MSDKNQREWERLAYDKQVTLDLGRGRKFSGKTQDVSLSGVFVETSGDAIQERIHEGETGQLMIQLSSGETQTFECLVIRSLPRGVALKFSKKGRAAFGLALSQDIFQSVRQSKPISSRSS